ncbi:hypothetical protein MalM25_22770 [Planctomycetes bacterium MalM25]|nr:hypothetical protein MalM25_22770 [Planctomycetes bacterium MalM25]
MQRFYAIIAVIWLAVGTASAVDLESFEFGDANDTALTAAANTANPGNSWFYDEEATTPGDASTGDVSSVQTGSYRVVTDSAFDTGLESRYLDIANVDSGQVFLSATLSSWQFNAYDSTNNEQLRFTFLDDDTGNSGSTVTAQMQIRRNADTGSMELFGDAIGTAGSFDIANTVDLPDGQATPFTMVLALDKSSNSFEVFYKDGSNPSQSLGLGGVSRARDANSIRMVTNNFGAENFPDFNVFNEFANIDRIAVSDTNPLTDLITLEVDRDTGAMTLNNTSGASVAGVTGVTLDSATGSVDLSDFIDFSGTLANSQIVALDSAPGSAPGLWVRTPVEDITATLNIAGGDRTVDVNFVGNGGLKWITGDLDFDGALDADDYGILTLNAETDLSGLSSAAAYQLGDLNDDGANDVLDFGIFKDDFIAANGAPAFARLVAGVPEPGTGVLALACVATLFGARRRSGGSITANHRMTSHPMTPRHAPLFALLASFALLSAARPANAVVLHDFLFNDTAGVAIEAAANSVDPLTLFDADSDSTGVTTNGLGQLDLSGKDNTSFGSHYIDINPGITDGKVYGVLEATWDFQSVLDPAENEELRISLISNDPRSTFITAQVEIERTDDDELVIFGNAFGTGSSNIPAATLNGGSLTQTDTFVTVLEADLTLDTYEVFFSADDGASFQSIGAGAIDPTRGVESARLVFNNDFVGDNVLLDRFFFAEDELPFDLDPEAPDRLTLYVHPISGHVAIVNDTETDFDIDYYRAQSGDDSLVPARWNSLQDRTVDAVDGADGGSIAGDGVGETWTEAGGSDAGVLSESFLLSSSVVSGGETLPLGAAFDLNGDDQQLTFEYRDATDSNVFDGEVVVGELLPGDFNLDGVVDAADYTVFRDNVSGLFTPADYTTWANNYGATLAAPAVAVPEPATLVIVVSAVILGCRRRQ